MERRVSRVARQLELSKIRNRWWAREEESNDNPKGRIPIVPLIKGVEFTAKSIGVVIIREEAGG